MPWKTPANFITHADDLAAQLPLSESVWPDHAVDLFKQQGQEQIVVLCNDDELRRIGSDFPLPREVKNEVACHRVSSPTVRNVAASEFYCMDVRTCDTDEGERQQRMARLSGTLYSTEGAKGEGELVLRVSELLYALCQAAQTPFQYANGAFYGLVLPGDTEDNLRQGRGMILAYPVPPIELRNLNFSNEEWLKQAFFDCLNIIQNDLKEIKPKAPFSLFTLPVPSRSMLIAELKQQGYQIVQDRAIASANSGSLAGRMLKIFGNLTGQGFALPPEATVDDYLKIGRETLQNHFEPVPYRMKALLPQAPPPPPPHPVVTMTTSPSIPKPSTPPPPTPQLPTQPKEDWLSDFGPAALPIKK
ncbi:hypothetical protein IV102_17325, partial [bacterium]|nr:hypothetical protein [bacterium]